MICLSWIIFVDPKFWFLLIFFFEFVLDDATKPPPSQKLISFFSNAAVESTHCFTLLEIEEWTTKFEKQIGSGGYGVVYYGKIKDGKEIAVKVLTSNSYQGKREFSNEVKKKFTLYWVKKL